MCRVFGVCSGTLGLVQQEKVSGSFKVVFKRFKRTVQKSQLHVFFLFPELLMITAYSTEKYCKRRKYHIFNGLFQSFKVLALRCASTLYT